MLSKKAQLLEGISLDEMSANMKKQRMDYCRYRVKVVCLAIAFLNSLSKRVAIVDKEKLIKKHTNVLIESKE